MPRTVIRVAGSTTQDLFKGLSELRAEDCVDDGIEGGVEVSEPEEEAEDMVIDTVVTDGTDKSQNKEREPTNNEGSGDDSQRFRCLLFSFFLQRNMFFGLLFLWIGVK